MTGTVDSTGRGHPVSLGVSRIADELKTLRDQPVWSMTAAETRAVLVEATRLAARVSELEARLALHAQSGAGGGRVERHQYGELVGARHPADPRRGAPEDQAGYHARVGGVRAGPGRARRGPAAGRPGPGDRGRGRGVARRPRRANQGRRRWRRWWGMPPTTTRRVCGRRAAGRRDGPGSRRAPGRVGPVRRRDRADRPGRRTATGCRRRSPRSCTPGGGDSPYRLGAYRVANNNRGLVLNAVDSACRDARPAQARRVGLGDGRPQRAPGAGARRRPEGAGTRHEDRAAAGRPAGHRQDPARHRGRQRASRHTTVLVPGTYVTEHYLTELFDLAADLSPCLILMDDLDLIAGERGQTNPHRLREFLNVMDGGLADRSGVVVIASTNDHRKVDKAARRSSRFDTVIRMEPPGRRGAAGDPGALPRVVRRRPGPAGRCPGDRRCDRRGPEGAGPRDGARHQRRRHDRGPPRAGGERRWRAARQLRASTCSRAEGHRFASITSVARPNGGQPGTTSPGSSRPPGEGCR